MKIEKVLTYWASTGLLVAAGCGSPAMNELRVTEVAQGLEAMESALGNGSETAAEAGQTEFDCTGGGYFSLNGLGSNIDVLFVSCLEDGIALDGLLETSQETINTGTFVRQSISYDGVLTFSGDIQGSCDLDYTQWAEASTQGAQAGFTGSFCGHDMTVVASASTEM